MVNPYIIDTRGVFALFTVQAIASFPKSHSYCAASLSGLGEALRLRSGTTQCPVEVGESIRVGS